LFIYSYPESEIHGILCQISESCRTEEFSGTFFEDKKLKNLSLPDRFYLSLKVFEFLFICRKYRTDIEILVRTTELIREFMDIYNSIQGEWNKYAPRSLDTDSCEVEMRIEEKGH